MFALVDCNNFFASCEMVFNPKLEKHPLVILSNNDGCVIARSKRAKELGIKMGDPIYLYKDRNDIVKLSSNFALYSDMSQRVMQTLSSLSPDMEIYSIDEAFFELEDSPGLGSHCVAMREKVKKWTGIPVSIGVAPTKTLAKLASEVAKKGDGVAVIRQDQVRDLLAATPPEDVWGIGRRFTERLKRRGIHSALQLSEVEDTWIQKELGIVGYRTVLELRGVACFGLEEMVEKKKSIVSSRSFGVKVSDLSILNEAVSSFVARAAEKLREQESQAGFLSVFIVTNRETASCHIQLPNPSSYTPELISLAKEGVAKIFRADCDYRKAGVMLGDFSEGMQRDFIHPTRKEKLGAMKVLDQINARYDRPVVRFAAQGVDQVWKSRRDHSTPKYTTNWSDLLKVKG